MNARHLSRLCLSRRNCSFHGALQASISFYQTKPSATNGLLSNTIINVCRSAQRSFSIRNAADGYLLELLKYEIKQSKIKIHPQSLPVKGVTVGPFVLMDKPGTEDVVLSRTVGSEKIEILCMTDKEQREYIGWAHRLHNFLAC